MNIKTSFLKTVLTFITCISLHCMIFVLRPYSIVYLADTDTGILFSRDFNCTFIEGAAPWGDLGRNRSNVALHLLSNSSGKHGNMGIFRAI